VKPLAPVRHWAYTGVMNETTSRDGAVSIAVGPIAALAAAGLLGGVRGDVGATNVALVLAGIVIVAAMAGRTAGFATAITAAMSFNFFHTAPYHSLRIDGGRDVGTVILLAVLGLMVSEVSRWRRRDSANARRLQDTAHRLEQTTALLAGGATADDVFAAVRTTMIEMLGLSDCRYEPGATSMRVIPRSGALVAASMHIAVGGFELPADGAAIAVSDGTGRPRGYLVLMPGPRHGSNLETRRAAIALADLYAIALDRRAATVTQ
jgi:hypothetical protein